jgi:hypothetical protein
MIRFVRAVCGDAYIIGLFRRQPGKLNTDPFQVQAGYFLV